MMKALFQSTLVLLAGTLLVAPTFGENADKPFESILGEYFNIQQSLSQDNTEGIDAAAQKIVGIVSAAEKDDGNGGHLLADLSAAALKIQGQDLSSARETFFELSKAALIFLNQHYSGDSNYFRYFCPMAKKGWIQSEEGTRNPYYGSSMLTCGQLITD